MRHLIFLAVASCLVQAAGCGGSVRDDAQSQRATARRLLDEQRRQQRSQIVQLEQHIGDNPDDPEPYVALGFAWIDRGDVLNADEQFDRALRLDRRHPRALCGKAVVALYEDEFSRALSLLDHLLTRAPDYAPAYYWRGQARQWQGEYDRAIEQFDRAIKLNPTYAEAYQARGSTRAEQQEADADEDSDGKADADGALADFQQAIFFNPRLANAHAACGDLLMDKDEHLRALRSYAQAIAAEPAEPYAYSRRGKALGAMEKYHDAIADFRLAQELAERTDRADVIEAMNFDFGVTLYYLGDYYGAIDPLNDALVADSENADALCFRGACFMETWGGARQAEDDYREAIRLYRQLKQNGDPDYDKAMHARALYGRARAYDEMQRSNKAGRDRREAKRVDPDYVDEQG